MNIAFNSQNGTLTRPQETPKRRLTDKFQTMVVNSADMNDCLTVPRTIFKGYLGIMMGTTMCALSSFATKFPKLKAGLNVAGLLTSAYGTWAFVRPYVLKNAHEVKSIQK